MLEVTRPILRRALTQPARRFNPVDTDRTKVFRAFRAVQPNHAAAGVEVDSAEEVAAWKQFIG